MPQLLTSATNVNCQASRVESLKNALHSLISVCKRMSLKQWGKIIFEGEFSFFRTCNFKRFVRNTHAKGNTNIEEIYLENAGAYIYDSFFRRVITPM